MDVTRETVESQALQVQVSALIDGWQRERAERVEMGAGAPAREQGYHEGYADALDRCVQALKMLRDG